MDAPGELVADEAPVQSGNESRPDETGDGMDRRLCAYSGCRAVLPRASGPGNRARYCQDGKTWGPKNVTCKQAGNAEEILASIRAESVSPAPPVTELAEHVAGALGPTRQLVATLERVGQQLDADVTAALRERDEAISAAADERGRRELADERAHAADQRAEQSQEAATTAHSAQQQAEADRDDAVRAKREAERAQVQAETQAAGARDHVERAENRLQAATERAERAEQQLASAQAELTALREQLEQERGRANTERQRAEHIAAQFDTRTAELTKDYEDRRTQARAEQAEALEQARAAAATEAKQLREEHEQHRAAAEDRHAREVAELHQRLGGQEQRLTELTERADGLARELTRYREGIRAVVGHAQDTSSPDEASSHEASSHEEPGTSVLDRLTALLDDDAAGG